MNIITWTPGETKNVRCNNLIYSLTNYTVNHKKTCHLIFVHTLRNVGRF